MKIQKSNYYTQNQKLNSLFLKAYLKYKLVDNIIRVHIQYKGYINAKKEGVNIIFDFRHTGLRGFNG